MSKILTSEKMLQTSRFAHPVGELDWLYTQARAGGTKMVRVAALAF